MAKAKQGVPDSDSLRRVSELCLALPEATCERSGSHATFRVRKKGFAYFLDNHRGEGFVGIGARTRPGAPLDPAGQDRERFSLPAYIGPRGWIGIRLDRPPVDWEDVARRITASYRAVAPKKLFRSPDALESRTKL